MHRKALLKLLSAYMPTDADEIMYKHHILEFINQHPMCFERSLAVGHITASAWLVSNDHTHALLMHHAKLNAWVQLGGHCDGSPDVLAVAVKEAQEESGINSIEPLLDQIFDIDIHLIPATTTVSAHYHYDIRFLLHVTSDEQPQRNNESKELRWVSTDIHTLPTTSRSVVRIAEKWINLKSI